MSEQHTYAGHTLAAIKAAAEAATPGPWSYDKAEEGYMCAQVWDSHGKSLFIHDVSTDQASMDSAYVAAANPATVLAMAARIDELEQQLASAIADHTAALRLVAEVRHACGDDGKRMPDELVQYVGEMAKDAARIGMLESNSSIEVGYESDDGDMVRVVHEVTGSRNDRQWKEIGRGYTLRAAIDAAMEQAKNREGA